MPEKRITYFGQPARVACDGQCHKAWGINNRPRVYLGDKDEDPDDYYFIPDHELPFAPADPGTYEGGHAKPCATVTTDAAVMNEWCVRECERAAWSERERQDVAPVLPDFSQRLYNIPSSIGRDAPPRER